MDNFPTRIEAVADYLETAARDGERAGAEDRLALCLALENALDELAELARNARQKNLVRRAVKTVFLHLREENFSTVQSLHLVVMAINRLRQEVPKPSANFDPGDGSV